VKENRNDSLRTLHFLLSICSKGACNGKELIARAIHDRRRHIAGATKIAAIATGLLVSELFGREKGDFHQVANPRS
jgi:transcriptional regulator with GAF, ATPase, and Fis domain